LPAITVGVILLDILCRFSLSTWPPAFANQQFLELATFARADSLAVGALLAQLERSGGLPVRRIGWAWVVALVAAVVILAIHRLEARGLVPLLTYNLTRPTPAAAVA